MAHALIVTCSTDPTADFLAEHLRNAGIKLSRLTVDSDHKPQISVSLSPEGTEATIETDRGLESVLSFSAIVWRRPQTPHFAQKGARELFLQREFMAGLRAALECGCATWINHPLAISASNSKIGNLRLAHTLGLRTPETLATSYPTAIHEWRGHHEESVIKPMTHGLLEEKDRADMIFAQSLPQDFDPQEGMEPGVPSIFQHRISKTSDVRVTVVGESVFAAKLLCPAEVLDWRTLGNEAKWERALLPPEIRDACIAMNNHLKLTFSAIDFAVSDNQHYFLELNPNGQWVWIEKDAGHPIAAAFAAACRSGA